MKIDQSKILKGKGRELINNEQFLIKNKPDNFILKKNSLRESNALN